MLSCKFCQRECKSGNSLKNHELRCKLNPDRKISGVAVSVFTRSPDQNRNAYTKAAALGLPKPVMSVEARAKISTSLRERVEDDETRQKRRNTIKAKVAEGTWHISLAKDMHYDYNGVDLHGTWELAYAKYLDESCVRWQRCKEQFQYMFEGETRHYTPDFYLPDEDVYVEIKGYETPKDVAKWSQFRKKLKVLKFQQLRELGLV